MKVTPGRRTKVRFDVTEDVLVEPPYCMERVGAEIGKGSLHSCRNLSYLDLAGWELATVYCQLDSSCVFSPNSENRLEVASGFGERELCLEVLPSGRRDLFLQKQVPAGTDWGTRLIDDEANFPSMHVSDGAEKIMDRVAVSEELLRSDQGLLFRFFVAGHGLHQHEKLFTVYFSGPAGCDKNLTGHGQYGIVLYGNGKAELYERGKVNDAHEYVWKLRSQFRFARSSHVNKFGHALYIRPLPYQTSQNGQGGSIHFLFSQHGFSGSVQHDLLEIGKDGSGSFVYLVPFSDQRAFPQSAPLRLDVHRHLRPLFQISRTRYEEVGTLQDSSFCLPFYPTEHGNLRLEWFGHVPEGCRIVGKLYDATSGETLGECVRGEDFCEYSVRFPNNCFYVEFTFEGDGAESPILYRYRVLRDACIQEVAPGEFEVYGLREVRLIGSDENPGQERGVLTFDCDAPSLERLRKRAYVPLVIEIESDDEDVGRCVLFRGYVVGTSLKQLGIAKDGTEKIFRCRCKLVGMWHRLNSTMVPVRFNWSIDPNAPDIDGINQAYKVVDVLRSLLNWSGFSNGMLEMPDAPMRLWPSDVWCQGHLIEPYVRLGDAIARLVREYLGSYLYFDGSCRKWRLRSYFQFSSEPVAHFTSSKSKNASVGFIRKGSCRRWLKPPEANHLCITGLGYLGSDGTPHRLTQVMVNSSSYDFGASGNIDPSHPDYLGGIVTMHIVDPSLSTESAVNWATKRYYDLYCKSQQMMSFSGPLLFVDGLRPLGFGDVVGIDDELWIVRSCHPFYQKDVMQMALYECEKVQAVN